MFTDVKTVIGGEDDDGIVCLAAIIERIKYFTYLGIHKTDRSIITVAVMADFVLCESTLFWCIAIVADFA